MIYKYAIDFGTTNSSIALRVRNFRTKKDTTRICMIEEEDIVKGTIEVPTMPSVIYVDENTDFEDVDSLVVGRDAKAKFAHSNAKHKELIREIKMRCLDKADIVDELQSEENGILPVSTLIAAILKKLKFFADIQAENLGMQPRGVVMGVPVGFSDPAKGLLLKSLVRAGFYQDTREAQELTEFVKEPIAVAVAYGLEVAERGRRVMVFDFGGGTLDVAILELNPGGTADSDSKLPHEELANGRISLAGEAFTRVLFSKVVFPRYRGEMKRYAKKLGLEPGDSVIDSWQNKMPKTDAGYELQEKLEELKWKLSDDRENRFYFLGPAGVELEEDIIKREEFEKALRENGDFEKIEGLVKECLNSANLEPYDIDDVLLAGGSSLIPSVQELLREDLHFSNKVHGCTIRNAVSRDVLTSIVSGLAVYACVDEAKQRKLVENIVDHDYGVWDDGQEKVSVILKSGTRYKDTQYNEAMAEGGCYKDYRAIGTGGADTRITLKVYEKGRRRDDIPLGSIDFSRQEGQYRIFMKMDDKSGRLVVDIYDKVRLEWRKDIPLYEREFDLSSKNKKEDLI